MTEKQRQENLVVEKKRVQIEKERDYDWYNAKVERLNNCSATVYTTKKYYILRSYATIVAAIDKNTDTCYDWLRLVYGYTATSTQHISKFMKKYGATTKKTWRMDK